MDTLQKESLTWDRPTLAKELEAVEEVWRLPAGAGDIRTMENNLLLLARYKSGKYRIIMDVPGHGKDKEGNRKPDKVTSWLFSPEWLQKDVPAEPSEDYILIEKSRLGRKKRILTEEERAEILARHEKREPIHAIAKALHMGTARVSEVIKQGR